MCNSSGIENENEIYSCAQLEAQQEQHSKSIEVSSDGDLRASQVDSSDTSTTTVKVVKRDNIVLGISDLKQQQLRKLSVESSKNNNKNLSNKKNISPIHTIKVNNCEIITRPRSVTASIFEHPTIIKATTNCKTPLVKAAPEIKKKIEEKQIFRPSQQNAPTSVTSTIFARRTKDMNPGYLMFTEDSDTGLTSKF